MSTYGAGESSVPSYVTFAIGEGMKEAVSGIGFSQSIRNGRLDSTARKYAQTMARNWSPDPCDSNSSNRMVSRRGDRGNGVEVRKSQAGPPQAIAVDEERSERLKRLRNVGEKRVRLDEIPPIRTRTRPC